MRRTSLIFVLSIILPIASACGRPSPEPTAQASPLPLPSRTPTPQAVATLALAQASNPTPRPTEEPTAVQLVAFPYLQPDQPLRLTSLKMVNLLDGWGVHKSDYGSAHVLKTNDGGLTWRDVSPPESVYLEDLASGTFDFNIATDFLDANHAWVSLSFGLRPGIGVVWRTADGGRHWSQGRLGRRNFGVDWIFFDFVDPIHGWAVIDVFHGAGSHSGEAFRTTDGGVTWERLLGDFGYASGIDFVDQQVGWITTDVFQGVTPPWTLLFTRDGGRTWKMTAPDRSATPDPIPGHNDCGFQVLHAFSALTGVVHRPNCRVEDAQGNSVFTSWLDFTTDAMRTWSSARMPPGTPEFINADTGWVVAPTDPDAPPPPSGWSLYSTGDGGQTWQSIRPLYWHGRLEFVDDRNGWGIGEDGIVHRTTDGGLTWEEIRARSAANDPPQDSTVFLDLPAEVIPVSLDSAPRLQLLATLPANDPTSLVMFRNTLFVGNAHGQVLQWLLAPKFYQQPKIWRVHDDWVNDLTAVDAGSDLVTASRDGLVRLWPFFTPEGGWLDFPIHKGEVSSVALSPDGSMLASGGEDGTVKVQELYADLTLDLHAHRGWVGDIAFSRDGTMLATASQDTTVKLWAIESGDLLGTLAGHTSTVSQVVFAPDSSQVASASWDGTIRVWEAASHDPLHLMKSHDDRVLGVSYAPAGNLLVTSGADGKVLLWDPARGELVSQLLDLDVPVRGVALDSQGRYLVAIADDDQVRIWAVVP